MTIARGSGYKGYVLRMRRDKNTRILEIFGPACSDIALSTATSVAAAKRWIDDYIDLEQTIAELVERKRAALVDSAEWTPANNALIALRYSADGAGDLIDDLDPGFGTTFRRSAVASPATEQQPKVLPFRLTD